MPISARLPAGARGGPAHHDANRFFKRHGVVAVSALHATCYQGQRGRSEQAAPPGPVDDGGGRIGEDTQGKTVRDGGQQLGAVIERDPRPQPELASLQELLIEVLPQRAVLPVPPDSASPITGSPSASAAAMSPSRNIGVSSSLVRFQ